MPSNSVTPCVVAERFSDIESQAARYRGYGQEYQQLSCGPFDGRVTSFDLGGDFFAHLETANQDLAQMATTPADRCGVCILTVTSPSCTLNGTTLTRDHLLVSPGGNAIFGRTPAGISMYCMDLARDLLLEETQEGSHIEIIHDPRGAHSLRELVNSGLTGFFRSQSFDQRSPAAKSYKSSVADTLWRVVSRNAHDATQRMPEGAKPRALRVFRVAREYINYCLTDGISVAEVCRHTGVSRRSLESSFQSIVGIGPGAYIRNLQLNRVRRDLLSIEKITDSIGDIAARYGVWHWSRFSRNYRLLFGELPSQTRARVASGSDFG